MKLYLPRKSKENGLASDSIFAVRISSWSTKILIAELEPFNNPVPLIFIKSFYKEKIPLNLSKTIGIPLLSNFLE